MDSKKFFLCLFYESRKVRDKKHIYKSLLKSELEILQVLWEFGPSTARSFVNDHLNKEKREVIYMSTLKLMQIMVEKGFLAKDESSDAAYLPGSNL